jgi:cytochrome c oxidase subunit 2
MRVLLWRLTLVLTLSISFSEVYADPAQRYAVCASCHGQQAQGNIALGAPALAGQLPDYLARQLNNFKLGYRGTAEGDTLGAQMIPFAAMLPTDADVQAMAQYLSALPFEKTEPTFSGDTVAGKSLYNSNCGDCHGAKGEGNSAFSAPALSHLSDQYLFDQFKKYQQMQRGFAKEDKRGRQMQFMSDEISNDDSIRDVVSYIQTLSE